MKALIPAALPFAIGLASSIAGAAGPSAQAVRENLARFLPGEVEGWKPAAADEIYTGDKIFEYIDGAGEVYKAYNYRSLLARRYAKNGQPDIIADLFDMGSDADAFGVFTHGLEGERLEIGQGAVSSQGQISFWKDRYFVSLYAETETPEVRRALLGLGSAVAGSIPGEGKLPGIIDLLPERFDPLKIRYFHNHFILNYHFFVSNDNILRLDDTTEAALAPSGEGAGKLILLIVRYPSALIERRAAESFTRNYLHSEAGSGPVQNEDGQWTAAMSRDDHLFVVFRAPSREAAASILDQAVARLGGRPS